MIADAERLNGCKKHGIQSLSVIHTLLRHGYILLKRPVSLASHGLVIHTCIHDSMLAGITVSAVKIWIAGYNHSRAKALSIVLIHLHDFRRKLMAWYPWIIEVCESPLVGTQIASTDSPIQEFQQNLTFLPNRFVDIPELYLTGCINIHCFH